MANWTTLPSGASGDYAKKPPGDVHIEQGGPDGALAPHKLLAPDGKLTEKLEKKGNTLRALTPGQLRRFFKKNSGQQPEKPTLLILLQLLVVVDH